MILRCISVGSASRRLRVLQNLAHDQRQRGGISLTVWLCLMSIDLRVEHMHLAGVYGVVRLGNIFPKVILERQAVTLDWSHAPTADRYLVTKDGDISASEISCRLQRGTMP